MVTTRDVDAAARIDEGDALPESWPAEVRRLARERDAVVLAHNYMTAEIQDVADVVGDSLALSRQAAATSASTIVFCGVHFMAETAKILSPDKTVLIPAREAGCSLADSIDGTLIAFADTSALTSDPDTQTYLQVMKTYAPSASTGGFAPTAFESVMDFYRAMLPVSDPSTLDAKTTAKALAQSTDVPLFMGDGKTFSCGKDLFKTAPSVCDPWGFLAQYSGGKLSLVGSYDSSVVLKGLA